MCLYKVVLDYYLYKRIDYFFVYTRKFHVRLERCSEIHDGSRGGTGGSGPPPMKNDNNIGFLSNT